MKPIIGVMPLWDEENDSIWMLPGYMDGVREAGGIPFIFPLTEDTGDLDRLLSMCQGILLTGGQNVAPEIYHETPLEGLIEGCTLRDRMETIVLKAALEQDIPVLGICRGIQFINAALGGTLFQDLPLQHPSAVCHRQKPPYDEPAHTVQVLPGTPLSDCLKAEEISVNSCHHQAVKDLAPGLEAMAVSPDGLIEALWKPDCRFLWAVQWHPEFSYRRDENSRKIFNAFIASSQG